MRRQLSTPRVTITVTQNNCRLSVYVLRTQICPPLALLSPEEGRACLLLWAPFKTFVSARHRVEAIICLIHPRNVCLLCPEITCLEKRKKSLKSNFLVSIDLTGMFQRIASNFGSSSSVVFSQGWFCPPRRHLAIRGDIFDCYSRGGPGESPTGI